MKFINYLNRTIEYSFYALFFLIPLVFSGAPSELFEFPKMWLTFGLTVLIGTAWLAKMILQKQFRIQKTPLDIPLILFLLSQIVSTIFSLDQHVSLWGYYSRFNGGLFSIISYIFLYYALVSNFEVKKTLRLIYIALLSGLIVALWGFPSHFGIDPTCYIFRQTFDTSCWTEAFKPTIRIFSTLGQPAWMAAFMASLIPVAGAYFLNSTTSKVKTNSRKLLLLCYLAINVLFYLDLIYTNTRGGFIAFWIANIVFWGGLILSGVEREGARLRAERDRSGRWKSQTKLLKLFLIFNITLLFCNFLAGSPIESLNRFSLPKLAAAPDKPAPVQIGGLEGTNITDSGNIRLLVWRGAIDTWKANPLIGSGVETFAFSYYKYKPTAHNLTSEWDYLYNKAHNEYLNYLATTGILGLGSYLLIIGVFIFQVLKYLISNIETRNSKQIQNTNDENSKLFRLSDFGFRISVVGLFAGYISILVSNFFGFSVVIINILFFLIPGFVFILSENLDSKKVLAFPRTSSADSKSSKINPYQWVLLVILFAAMIYKLSFLWSYWGADIAYATGSNLDRAGSYQDALKPLQDAVNAKPDEPVYKDELSTNLATIAAALLLEKDSTQAAKFEQTAIKLSDKVTRNHPNDVVYWKNRVRLFYTLSQGDKPREKIYLRYALTAIEKAQSLAPNDAKISYNLGVLKGQFEGPQAGIEVLENTVKLKPDYRDAYFALGLFYHDAGENQKAITAYRYILRNIDPHDLEVQKSLKEWEK